MVLERSFSVDSGLGIGVEELLFVMITITTYKVEKIYIDMDFQLLFGAAK
jgi:hypothetical protein